MEKGILILGYGNPGRQDDGLGPALVSLLEQEHIPGLKLESDYQLSVENAYDCSQCRAVIFVDASEAGAEPFFFEELQPGSSVSFTTHAVSPASVLYLSRELYDTKAKAFLMGIRGYGFEFSEGLTAGGTENLAKAGEFIRTKIAELGAVPDGESVPEEMIVEDQKKLQSAGRIFTD